MQIQRIQTVFLLCVVALLTVFIFTPFGYTLLTIDGEELAVEAWYPRQSLGLTLPAAIGALDALVSIFMFRNFTIQKLLVKFSILLTLVAVGVTVYFLVAGTFVEIPDIVPSGIKWGGGGLLLLAALIAEFQALSHIRSDERILRDMDRLR